MRNLFFVILIALTTLVSAQTPTQFEKNNANSIAQIWTVIEVQDSVLNAQVVMIDSLQKLIAKQSGYTKAETDQRIRDLAMIDPTHPDNKGITRKDGKPLMANQLTEQNKLALQLGSQNQRMVLQVADAITEPDSVRQRELTLDISAGVDRMIKIIRNSGKTPEDFYRGKNIEFHLDQGSGDDNATTTPSSSEGVRKIIRLK